MHQIASALPDYEASFSPYYADSFLDTFRRAGLLEWTILGNKSIARTTSYLRDHGLTIDPQGQLHDYDLVVTCQDLIVPKNIRRNKIVLVQEGMTDAERIMYHVVRSVRFVPRWLGGTAATGLSDLYDRFCVASEGYRELFIHKGVQPGKIEVTGIPNFDNCRKYLSNNFPHKHFVLACTSDSRETFVYENRKKFIRNAIRIAGGPQLIFKLHPNENVDRATKEINRFAPGAIVYADGKAEEMVANCDVLITRFSSTAFVGLALGKEVHSDFDLGQLRRLLPLQNNSAAAKIAGVCRKLIEQENGATELLRHRRTEALHVSKVFQTTARSVMTETE